MRPRSALALAVLISLLGCRQPSAALELPADGTAEPTGRTTPSVFVEAATVAEASVILDWTKVDGRLAELVDGERYRIDYDADHPWAGAATPLVTIVVFFDYQCPYCHRLDDALASLRARYPDRVRVVWRQFPLKMHPEAEFAAAVALAAHAQGAFMPMHEWLFDNSRSLTAAEVERHAASLGLDSQRLIADVDSGWFDGRVSADIEFGERFEVRATPSYFINGRPFRGAKKLEELEVIVREELIVAEGMIAAGADPREVWARILAASASERVPTPTPAPTPTPTVAKARYATQLKGLPERGAKKPKIELLMCGDFDCPYSKRSTATLEQLLKDHKGDLAVYFRHHPLPMHQHARAAHRAAVAAENQGKFWDMFDLLYAEPKKRSDAELEDMAKQLGLDIKRFRKDIAAQKTDERIDEQVQFCQQDLDASGTPSFFINGRPLTGARPIADFEVVIKEELAGKGPP